MISFSILKQSKKSGARAGILKTPHGIIETPALVPVATQAAVKTLQNEEVLETGTQMLIANTFHLHERLGEKVVASHGGIHKFMKWKKPLMTDSGGFQVFSLGFGSDLQVGKITKRKGEEVSLGRQPQNVKITDEGVYFRSPRDGRKMFLGPRESIRIQEKIGADIIFAFDECTPPSASYEYTKKSLLKTHAWAEECLNVKKTSQALYGVVQGGRYKDLRRESAKYIASLPFDGYGIGGEFGNSKKTMIQMLRWTIEELQNDKPRHLLGIGHPEDILPIIKQGVDTFDCIAPTHYARHGTAFTSKGKVTLSKSVFLKDKKPLDSACSCKVCKTYSRGYLAHLLRAKEITALTLLTFHNLYFFHSYIAKIQKDILRGKI